MHCFVEMFALEKIKLGVSACLVGEKVRYDGTHRLDSFLADTLGRFVEYVPVCPEVECGLGVPRETIRLTGRPDTPGLVTSRTGRELTGRMVRWARKRIERLSKENLCGFVFKSRSPSCGPRGVKVFDGRGGVSRRGVGIFARMFAERLGPLPAEDERRLRDERVRENFIERIFAVGRWLEATSRERSRDALAAFHAEHALLLMAHSPKHARRMDKLVADAARRPLKGLYDEYFRVFMEAMKLRATREKHTRVLIRVLGHFKGRLDAGERREMLEAIDDYRARRVPLLVPVTLANHYARKFDVACLRRQLYLKGGGAELALRYHA